MQRTVIGKTGVLRTRPNKRWCDVQFDGIPESYKIRTTNLTVIRTPTGEPVSEAAPGEEDSDDDGDDELPPVGTSPSLSCRRCADVAAHR